MLDEKGMTAKSFKTPKELKDNYEQMIYGNYCNTCKYFYEQRIGKCTDCKHYWKNKFTTSELQVKNKQEEKQ